jgi:gliding motility-associated transport system permease protein
MRNTWIILRKEVRSYFVSPVAYVLLTGFGVFFGLVFWNYLAAFVNRGMQMSSQSFPMNINDELIRPLLGTASFIGLFTIPLITMRVFAEEKRTGTIELLATSPVLDGEIIVGKWLAAMVVYCCMLLFPAADFIFLFRYGHPDWKPMAIGFLGLLLQGGALLSIGTFISTLSRNQIVAAFVTFIACLSLWILDWPAGYDPATWARVLSYMSVRIHIETFTRGVADSKDGIYYATLTVLGLFLTARSMESLRWRS